MLQPDLAGWIRQCLKVGNDYIRWANCERIAEAQPTSRGLTLEAQDRRRQAEAELKTIVPPLIEAIKQAGGDPTMLRRFIYRVDGGGGPEAASRLWEDLTVQLQGYAVELLQGQLSRPLPDRALANPAAPAEDRPLPPSRVHAHESYVRALEHNPELKGQPLRKVYDWLKEHDPDQDYKLPRFVSWTRCLRAYRQDQRGAFTSPRASRPHGPSVVHHDQL